LMGGLGLSLCIGHIRLNARARSGDHDALPANPPTVLLSG
jgi:hypothetical protein